MYNDDTSCLPTHVTTNLLACLYVEREPAPHGNVVTQQQASDEGYHVIGPVCRCYGDTLSGVAHLQGQRHSKPRHGTVLNLGGKFKGHLIEGKCTFYVQHRF